MKKTGTTPKKFKREKGQSLVEFAVALVFLLLILSGIADLGRLFFQYIAMRDAAQEGVLYGSIFPEDCTGIINRTKDLLTDKNLDSDPEVLINNVACNLAGTVDRCGTNQINVTVRDTFKISMPYIGAFVGNSIPLHVTINGTILRCND